MININDVRIYGNLPEAKAKVFMEANYPESIFLGVINNGEAPTSKTPSTDTEGEYWVCYSYNDFECQEGNILYRTQNAWVRIILPIDRFIGEHLSAGIRKAKRALGLDKYTEIMDYSTSENEEKKGKYEDLTEAVKCLALASLLPGSNTFFVEGIPGLQEKGISARLMNPGDIAIKVKDYQDTAVSLINQLKDKKIMKGFTVRLIGGVR